MANRRKPKIRRIHSHEVILVKALELISPDAPGHRGDMVDIVHFTHTTEMDWLLPGVPPTGRIVEVAMVAIVKFHGDKIVHEHIYWDQASVLVQIGLLEAAGLPVAGVQSARKVADQMRPSNQIMTRWVESKDKPL